MVRRQGFSLLEVLVALFVLQMALLGVAGSVVLAHRALTRAERLERAVAHAERTYDSLAAGAPRGSGALALELVELRWSVARDGGVEVVVLVGADSVLAAVEGRQWGPGP